LIGPPETLVRELQTIFDHGGLGRMHYQTLNYAGSLNRVYAKLLTLNRSCGRAARLADVDLRALDWRRCAAVTALTPALSCRSCRPNAPFAELVCLSKSSVAEEYYAERSGNRWVSE
jgi:hypothetical protein